MEQDTPSHVRPSALSSGPLRLALVVGLTAVAVLAPLISAVSETDARGLPAAIEPTPTMPAAPTPTPVPGLDVDTGSDMPAEAEEPQQIDEPIVVAEPAEQNPTGTAAVATVPAVTVANNDNGPEAIVEVAVADAEDTSCLLVEDPETDAEPASETEPAADAEPASWFRDSFDALSPEWRPMAGSWSVNEGSYVQSNADGYDLITELVIALPDRPAISVDLVAQGSSLGGGLMIAQPIPASRNGATIVDFTAEGRFLRWGMYDIETGVYQYQGGVPMPDNFDTTAKHTLAVELQSERTRVLVDGTLAGVFDPVEPGPVGLVTSASAVAFDNMVVTDLNAGSNDEN